MKTGTLSCFVNAFIQIHVSIIRTFHKYQISIFNSRIMPWAYGVLRHPYITILSWKAV